MAISDARRRAIKKWNDANMKTRYDRLQVLLPAGQKKTVETAAIEAGESLSKYTQQALLMRMGLDDWPDVEGE